MKQAFIQIFLVLSSLMLFVEGCDSTKNPPRTSIVPQELRGFLAHKKDFEDIFQLVTTIPLASPDTALIGLVGNVKVDNSGTIYVVDGKSHRILVFDRLGRLVRKIGTLGEGPGELKNPFDVFIHNGRIHVSDAGNTRISVYDTLGRYLSGFSTRRRGTYLIVDKLGSYFFVSDRGLDLMVHKYASDGTLVKSFGEAPDNVKLIKLMITGGGIDLDTHGNIVYAHAAAYRLQWFTPDGELLRTKTRETQFYKAPAEAPNMSDPGAMRRWLSGWTPIVRVIALRNGLLVVEIRLNQHDLERYESMLELFDDSGELIAGGIRSQLRPLCKDDHNQLFFYNPRELDANPNKNPTILVYRFKAEKAL